MHEALNQAARFLGVVLGSIAFGMLFVWVLAQVSSMPGADTRHLYLASILSGLAANPATMLNIEEHLEYAIKLAELAGERATHRWG